MTDPDFVELFNGGSGQVNLRGYKVRDHNATWYALPDDAMIPAGGFYIINRDGLMSGARPARTFHSSWAAVAMKSTSLGPTGSSWTARRGHRHHRRSQNQSLGRVPDQTGPFVVLTKPSRGKSNQ